jgi:hypothetical protein
MGAGQVQVIAQQVYQKRAVFDVRRDRSAIYREFNR